MKRTKSKLKKQKKVKSTAFISDFDPLGSWTGTNYSNPDDKPEQDADDL